MAPSSSACAATPAAGRARLARRRIARGADAVAAPRVHAPRTRREQPAPPAAVQRPELQPLRALAWLAEGAAVYFSGQGRHLRAAIARRLREGGRPAFPP